MPTIILIVVVLPAPFGPRNPNTRPARTSKLRSSTATKSPTVATEFSTIELRRIFVAGLTSLPLALRGLLGEPINLETMGGFLSWRVGNTLPVLLGLWPVIALSGTLAGEAAKGSLDLLASTPQGRRTIALEKLAGHVTAVVLAMLGDELVADHQVQRDVAEELMIDLEVLQVDERKSILLRQTAGARRLPGGVGVFIERAIRIGDHIH